VEVAAIIDLHKALYQAVAMDLTARTRLVARGAACLWLALTGMYSLALGPLALPGLVPAVALLVRGASRSVLQGSAVFGLLAAVLGAAVYQGTTLEFRFEVVGVVVLPVAIIVSSCFALWRMTPDRPVS